MNSLLVLTTLPYYKKIIEKIESAVPKSSILWINSMTKDDELFRLSTKPFYSEAYFVIIEVDSRCFVLNKVERYLDVSWVRPVFLCPTKGIYNNMRDKLTELGEVFHLFNCYRVGFFTKLQYVRKCIKSALGDDFKVDNDVVSYIAKRINGYENSLEHILVTAVGNKSKLTKRAVGQLMPDKKYVTLGNFMLTLLTVERNDVTTIKLLSSMITRYRNYVTPLNRAFREFFNNYEAIYNDYYNGQFNELTYLSWVAHAGSKYGVNSEYQAKLWLEILSKYSYEFIALTKMRFTQELKKNALCGYSYIVMFAAQIMYGDSDIKYSEDS